MSDDSSPPLPAGSMLAHYRIEEPVGEGAMGRVYRAHDEGLDRKVAVKVLRPGVSGMTIRVDRFFREARAAARVNHPNLTHVYYVGADGSVRFFAMEFIQGQSLEEYLEEHGPLDLETALDILGQAACGLAAAHEAGIIHRDVKPSNILIRPDGTVKITDFGLSKSLSGDPSVSQEGTVTGTPKYMSPEQCRGQKVDARTDVYALGLTAWTLLVGRPPFPGTNLGQVLDDQIHAPLPSLRAERPDLPRSIHRVIAAMCRKDPDKRPADMNAVVSLLDGCRPRAFYAAPLVARAVAVALDVALTAVAFTAVAFPLERYAGYRLSDDCAATVMSLIICAYTLFSELRYGQTLGKWFLGLAVRAADGSEPQQRAIWMRLLWRFPGMVLWATGLPTMFAWLDAASSLLSLAAIVTGVVVFYVKRGRSLSDAMTRTRVVYVMPPEAVRASDAG